MIVVSKSQNGKIPPKMKISEDWAPRRDNLTSHIVSEGSLWDFTEKIAHSRIEGKNRRDGATVSNRVLRLTDTIGETLYQEAMNDANMEDEDKLLSKRKKKIGSKLQARAQL